MDWGRFPVVCVCVCACFSHNTSVWVSLSSALSANIAAGWKSGFWGGPSPRTVVVVIVIVVVGPRIHLILSLLLLTMA